MKKDRLNLTTTATNSLLLRPLTSEDEAVFFKSAELWPDEELSWYSFIYRAQKDFSYRRMLARLFEEQNGISLAADRVPATMLYAFKENEIVGRFHIRHYLNDYLLKRGGNVGYAVAPQFRQQGI